MWVIRMKWLTDKPSITIKRTRYDNLHLKLCLKVIFKKLNPRLHIRQVRTNCGRLGRFGRTTTDCTPITKSALMVTICILLTKTLIDASYTDRDRAT